ncbi:MAG: SDR family NAD(P)-dependent oxidoreductase [Elusimicrobiota bacterium]
MSDWSCLITGASRGIGAALAVRLAKPGRIIGINYSSSHEAALTVAKAVEERGAKALLLKADISNILQVDAMFARLPDSLDVLVLNAFPTPRYARLHETLPQEFERQWRVGALGAALCCRHALPPMMKRKSGRVVFVVTSAAQGAAPGFMGAYVSAKYALLGLAKAVEAEAGPRGVRVSCAYPGMTETDMIKDFPRPVVDAAREAAGRLSTPDEVAESLAALVEAA